MASAAAVCGLGRLMPTVFIPHGGGPLPILGHEGHKEMVTFLRGFGQSHLSSVPPPSAILLISAHWEERVPTIQTSPSPALFYDYYGFPEEAYSIDYPAKGDPKLAQRIGELLKGNGIAYQTDSQRGYDHGTFIPLKLMFPGANIPVVQLSLCSSLSPREHIAIGTALSPLREEGVLIIGSGMSFHGSFGRTSANVHSVPFHNYLRQALVETKDEKERREKIEKWESAPSARACHPREEHLLPLMPVLGAAGSSEGKEVFLGDVLGVQVAAYLFG